MSALESDLPDTTSASRVPAKPHRSLACELCQKRKVRCDKKLPCGSCVQQGVECIPTTLPRPRRRRFPERELLDRLRHYEDLLRKNNVRFEPLHVSMPKTASRTDDPASRYSGNVDGKGSVQEGDSPSRKSSVSGTVYEAKSIWHAMNQREIEEDGDDEEDENEPAPIREVAITRAWDHYGSDDQLLFGTHHEMNLSTVHPDQIQIFRLWQLYLENVDPLFKVTHAPTLQARLIDAARDITNIPPKLEALMFAIYCISIQTLEDDECRAMFGITKQDLMKGYRGGCQQALRRSGVLRSGDRECLTALYLYLVSVRADTDPRSLSATLGIAIRIAQRMGLHSESANARCDILEAEMRRRLWWSLALFDSRVSEMDGGRSSVLAPTWDCAVPSNLNDGDLQPAMTTPPAVHERPTEGIFAALRAKMGDFVRHTSFHLDFTNPILKSVATNPGGSLALEQIVENEYLRFCTPEHPLQFMSIWTARCYIAKSRLMEHYCTSSVPPTDAQRDAAIETARAMLVADTKLLGSPLTRKYVWFVEFQFPFPAYVHLAQEVRKRPMGEEADKTWQIMSDNYKVRFKSPEKDNPFFQIFSRMILQAWGKRESKGPEILPAIVEDIKKLLGSNVQTPEDFLSFDFSMPMLMDVDDYGMFYGTKYEQWADHGQLLLRQEDHQDPTFTVHNFGL